MNRPETSAPFHDATPATALNVLNAARCPDSQAMHTYYQALRARPGLPWDATASAWVAAQPALAREALQHPDLGVRPPGQTIPESLQGRCMGHLFGRWLRMREDPAREIEKAALQAALSRLSDADLAQAAHAQAGSALTHSWSHWQWASLPCSLAALLGLRLSGPQEQGRLLQSLAAWAAALRPGAQAAECDKADQALASLSAALGQASPGPLARALQTVTPNLPEAHDRLPWWITQALALLWQSYEAGAGLLGQGLLEAAKRPWASPPELKDCHDLLACPQPQAGAIHHTRRFALRDCMLAGHALSRGEALVVLLADGETAAADSLHFGFARHRCSAQTLALRLAAQALATALAAAQEQDRALPNCQGFASLANARIPELGEA